MPLSPIGQRCRIKMSDGESCGREFVRIVNVPGQDVCPLHRSTRSPEVELLAMAELQAILGGTSKHSRLPFDLSGFFLPPFAFTKTHFTSKAFFNGATFTGPVTFDKAVFEAGVAFDNASFRDAASFLATVFDGPTSFNSVEFVGKTRFMECRLDAPVFTASSFAEASLFFRCRFSGHTVFGKCTWRATTEFLGSEFAGPLNFVYAKFLSDLRLEGCICKQGCVFQYAVVAEGMEIVSGVFGQPSASAPGLELDGLVLRQPSQVRLSGVNEGTAVGLLIRLGSCRIDEVSFDSVSWFTKKGRLVLADEYPYASLGVRYEPAAIAYRRLMKNFEAARQDDLAEDCYYGQMEMTRRNPRSTRRRRSVLWLYKLASGYGGNYARAFGVLCLLILAGAGGYASFGLSLRQASEPAITLRHAVAPPIRELAKGLFHSLQVASFQRETRYQPVHALGQALATLETVVVPAQLALLLLALNRRFKR